jgi:hypothetical protein
VKDDQIYLRHIAEAIEDIERYTSGNKRCVGGPLRDRFVLLSPLPGLFAFLSHTGGSLALTPGFFLASLRD